MFSTFKWKVKLNLVKNEPDGMGGFCTSHNEICEIFCRIEKLGQFDYIVSKKHNIVTKAKITCRLNEVLSNQIEKSKNSILFEEKLYIVEFIKQNDPIQNYATIICRSI